MEKILYQNGDKSEVKFVNLVRNWYEACDKWGIHTLDRLMNMNKMFCHLLQWHSITDFPPLGKYVKGMPIQTYEMILQNISTRMQLFHFADKPINQRSISTLAIESFFSELMQMEFTGIGCPKSVDIPHLITYVTSMNNIHHDPERLVFKFIMTNNYF